MSIEAIGGVSKYAVSECQMPPKLCRSCSSFLTSITSGKPGSPFTNGYSIGGPMARAKARSPAGASFWPRKKMTWCSRNACLTSFSEKFFDRSTSTISAPSAPEIGRTSSGTLLLELDVGVADHAAVALLLAPQERRHLVRRHRRGFEAEREIAFLEVRRVHGLLHFAGEAHQDFFRRASRSAIADPGTDVIAGQVRGFCKRRHIRHRRRAAGERNAERFEPPGFDVADDGRHGFDGVVHLPVHHIGERRRAAFVRNVPRLDAGH